MVGWRKHKSIRSGIKEKELYLSRAIYRNKSKKNRDKDIKSKTKSYLNVLQKLSEKINLTFLDLELFREKYDDLKYFHEMLDKHISLIDRRLLKGEKIDSKDKIYSIYQPHTEWLSKGKANKKVELGIKLLITTDQYSLIQDYKIMEKKSDSEEVIALVDRLVKRFRKYKIYSLSFDKGFYSKVNKDYAKKRITKLVMPKKGKRNKAEEAEERENDFVECRNKHSAIESNINCLEHHGLDKCPDKSLQAYKRYVGLGILAYNLHKIGNELKKQALKKIKKRA